MGFDGSSIGRHIIRDIKSENVLLTSRMRVKICDFGLSRSAEEVKKFSHNVMSSSVIHVLHVSLIPINGIFVLTMICPSLVIENTSFVAVICCNCFIPLANSVRTQVVDR